MVERRSDREALRREAATYLAARHGLSEAEARRILNREGEVAVPVTVFVQELTPLEALVKHLRENEGLRLVRIAELTGRDQRAISVTYRRARTKFPGVLPAPASALSFPVALLLDRRLSPAEHLTNYLREAGLSYSEIARRTRRDDRTIWTLAARARRKVAS
jgi:DNA-directed RNA polymerase specialized sigma24 family protein